MDKINDMAIEDKLVDDESKRIYTMLKKYSLCGNYQKLIHDIKMMNYTWDVDPYDLIDIKEKSMNKKIVIFGASSEGEMTADILENNGFSVFAFCDNNSLIQNTKKANKKVMSVKNIIDNKEDYFVIISSYSSRFAMYDQLIQARFPRENIHFPRIGKIFATTGKQYFDCEYIKPLGDQEVFIDCGCYDMATSINFIAWNGGKYKKIYAFEPDKDNFKKCELIASQLDNVNLLPLATWNQSSAIGFVSAGQGARIDEKDKLNEIVKCAKIDDVLDGNVATYIKMDVEGAEIPSLEGGG